MPTAEIARKEIIHLPFSSFTARVDWSCLGYRRTLYKVKFQHVVALMILKHNILKLTLAVPLHTARVNNAFSPGGLGGNLFLTSPGCSSAARSTSVSLRLRSTH